jgi:hypothetical protein
MSANGCEQAHVGLFEKLADSEGSHRKYNLPGHPSHGFIKILKL